ncbi:FAD-dependent oxidoreductase [Streptomyces sp. NPDC041068]|uniref:FAD-dependent oxidoreductase n=1 Tax=Streptomyces sp. NPDC041068 TaxID=3155130 RepID=UPI0033CC75A1
MIETGKDATVVIVGGGVAGLALGNFLLRKGVGCTVLEKHSREAGNTWSSGRGQDLSTQAAYAC